MENIYYVYKHVTKDSNETFYIGKGKNYRAFSTKSRNRFWKNIVEKHEYVVEFVSKNLTEQEALNLEIEEIRKNKPRANMSVGGKGGATGYKHNPETVKKRNEKNKKINKTAEGWLRKSLAQKETQNRPDVKAKVQAGKANFYNKLRTGQIIHPLKGKPISEETKRKVSEAQKGSNGYWYGKVTAVAKKVINVDSGQVFQSLKEAAQSVNGHRISLARAIKSGRKFKKNRFSFL